MCGISGIFHNDRSKKVNLNLLKKMNDKLVHRGPDSEGYYLKNHYGLSHRRLKIIDLDGGDQPIFNEDKSICVVFNGEIFNYIELRDVLTKKGHVFRTKTDTEVIVHAYEEYGMDFVQKLNGQFAIAILDENKDNIILIRDRVGISPLFYSISPNKDLIFASEQKALLEHPDVQSTIDPEGFEEIFTLWVNIPPTTCFKDIKELAPGHYLIFSKNKVSTHSYWDYDFPEKNQFSNRDENFYMEKTQELLEEAVRIRLRADVDVGCYLSGGLDSSIISSLAKKFQSNHNRLATFSLAFEHKDFDESYFQNVMTKFLKCEHHSLVVDSKEIANSFDSLIYNSEKPTLRTGPAPLQLLSKFTHDLGYKVVLTGEGADEVFGGYNIFKESKVRRFWAKDPKSKIRPALLRKTYPYLKRGAESFWQAFFKQKISDTTNPYYSHIPRWSHGKYLSSFFHEDIAKNFNSEKIKEKLDKYFNPNINKWDPLNQAQYIEMKLFMPGYLLSSQGDRVLMQNSVEGRFPFLDHNLIEFAATIPPKYKLDGMNEKSILKKIGANYLPKEIFNRPKNPYRAPISESLLSPNRIGYDLISEESLSSFGLFSQNKVLKLIEKMQKNPQYVSERDNMALSGISSAQLLYHYYVRDKK